MGATADVVVIGGGLVGLAAAYALAKEGQRVLVVEAGEVGREASWAAGGILSPIRPDRYPAALYALAERSLALYGPLCEELEDRTGAGVELRRSGLLLLAVGDEDEGDLASVARWREERGLPVERLTGAAVRAVEPSLAPGIRFALRLPDVWQVRNPRLLKALAQGCAALGVRTLTHTPALGFEVRGGRLAAVRTAAGDVAAGGAVLAAGSWSGGLARGAGLALPVEPVKGQMLLLRGLAPPLGHVVVWRDQYLVPRGDGRILLGSTVEDAGFDKSVTAEGMAFLLGRGIAMCPPLARAGLETAWAGLRPGTPDRLPYLGVAPGVEGLVVATGHFRNGILLGPVTGEIARDLCLARRPPLPLEPFRVGRP